jgi:ABC-type Zn uptake system ZnuABC Zn-binding protein ZnuA
VTALPTRGSLRSLAFLSLTLLVPACAPAERGATETGRPLVVASIFPVGDLARRIAGEDVQVEVLLPARASPSTFEPTARQMALFSGATAYLFVGGGMDRWAERLVQPGDVVVRLIEGMTLLQGDEHEGDPGTGNPHVWLDPVLVRDELLPRIEAVLNDAAPEHAAGIAERRAALADSLTALDAEIRAALAAAPTHAFVSTHSAWVYYARRYGLDEIGAIYASPGREPSSRHLAQLVDGARAAGVRAVFIEPQLGEAGARTVASELGVGVHLLDPQGGEDQPGRDSYASLLRFNTAAMVEALGGGG